VPDFFLDNGRQDTLATYLYYRKHYWDGVDFSDDRVLRTPVFHRKLEKYMDHVLPRHPDTLIAEIDTMIAKTNGNSDMEQYLLWYFTSTYESSNIMGYDKIFVHMVDKYFTNRSYDWLNTTVQKNMIDRVNQLRNVLIAEFAPALIMADTNGSFISLHQQEAEYIIVLFWTTTCGECKREVNKLKAFYEETELDLKVFAVNTDTVFSDWKKYIRDKNLDWVHVNGNISLSGDYHETYDIFSTPVIFVLDRNKKIIAKRLSAERIPDFLSRRRNN
ncbi:MAG TPA: thioredoxin-like domain-containing protein, partial [Bacteroidales bacterium]|nr:thioredoxin-like domain-containing protein [Bacteroidales bacterium]